VSRVLQFFVKSKNIILDINSFSCFIIQLIARVVDVKNALEPPPPREPTPPPPPPPEPELNFEVPDMSDIKLDDGRKSFNYFFIPVQNCAEKCATNSKF